MTRAYKLKIAILRALKTANDVGFMLRAEDLHNELLLSVRPAPLASETQALVEELDREKLLLGVRDGEILRLKITPAGEAWFRIQVAE